jgi:hypothetical protein
MALFESMQARHRLRRELSGTQSSGHLGSGTVDVSAQAGVRSLLGRVRRECLLHLCWYMLCSFIKPTLLFRFFVFLPIFVGLFLFSEMGTHYLAQAGLKLMIFLTARGQCRQKVSETPSLWKSAGYGVTCLSSQRWREA